jgi:hypothetical protein
VDLQQLDDLDERPVVDSSRHPSRGLAALVVLICLAGVGGLVSLGLLMGDGERLPAGPGADTPPVGRWRLAEVANGQQSTPVAPEVHAVLTLSSSGRMVIDNGTDTLTGIVTFTPNGFVVRSVGTTLAVYGGTDPGRLAAIAGLNALAYGNSRGETEPGPVRSTVVSASSTTLVIEAVGTRLTFERSH